MRKRVGEEEAEEEEEEEEEESTGTLYGSSDMSLLRNYFKGAVLRGGRG